MAPDFTLTDCRGEEISLSGCGMNPVVIVFFGTWSEQAQKHIARTAKLYGSFHEQGLQVFGITAETDSAQVRRFAEQNGFEFPILIAGSDVMQRYEVGGVPDTYCITRCGFVCERLVGFSPETEQILENVVQLMVKKVDESEK
jgi:peroxiredoxin